MSVCGAGASPRVGWVRRVLPYTSASESALTKILEAPELKSRDCLGSCAKSPLWPWEVVKRACGKAGDHCPCLVTSSTGLALRRLWALEHEQIPLGNLLAPPGRVRGPGLGHLPGALAKDCAVVDPISLGGSK